MDFSYFKRFKGIIFDLDGTLIVSNHVWSNVDKEFLGKRGIEVPEDYFKVISSMNFGQAAEYSKKRFGLPESPEEISKEWFSMVENEYAHNIKLVKGADRFLKYLHDNKIKIALATASTESLYVPVLKNNGVYDYFDAFVSTEEVSRGKGFPDVYLLAAEKLGLTAGECAVFEDIADGIKGAKLGGFKAFACLNEHYRHEHDYLRANADSCFYTYV